MVMKIKTSTILSSRGARSKAWRFWIFIDFYNVSIVDHPASKHEKGIEIVCETPAADCQEKCCKTGTLILCVMQSTVIIWMLNPCFWEVWLHSCANVKNNNELIQNAAAICTAAMWPVGTGWILLVPKNDLNLRMSGWLSTKFIWTSYHLWCQNISVSVA